MPQFLATRVNITPSNPSAWNDVDLSSYIAAGSSGVIIHVRNASASTRRNVGWRKKGSTDNIIDIRYQSSHSYCYCGVDANRIVQLYIGSSTDITYTLVGYFTSAEASFFTNSILISAGASAAPGTYVAYDVTPNIGSDTAIGIMMEVVTSGADSVGLRRFGSTVDLNQDTSQHGGFLIGLSSNKVELKVQDATNTIYMNGYLKTNATFQTDPVIVSATPNANIGTYQDLSLIPAGSLGGIYLIRRPTVALRSYALRKKGSSTDIYYNNPFFSSAVIDCDANGAIEGKTQSSDDYIYQIGYFTAPAATNVTVDVPVTQIDITALIETVTTTVNISDPVTTINISGLIVSILTESLLYVDSTTINIESLIPIVSGDSLVIDDVTSINVTGQTPDILTEVFIETEIANINISSLTPYITGDSNVINDIANIDLTGLEPTISTEQILTSDITTINVEGLVNEVIGNGFIDCDIGLINIDAIIPTVYIDYTFVDTDIETILISGLDADVILQAIAEPDITQISIDGLIPIVIGASDTSIIQDSSGSINIDTDNPLVLLTSLIIITPLLNSFYLLPQIPTIKTGCTSFPDITTIDIQGLDGEFRVDNDIIIDTLTPININSLLPIIILDDLYIYPPITQIDISALVPTLLTNLVSPENYSAYLSVLKRVVVLETY